MIIWIASYPKSGNTWVRSMVSSLVYSENGIFNFNQLSKISQFPNKEYFEKFTNNFGDIHQIKKYWITAQDKINLDNRIKFFKTHHINCKIGDHSFTNKENTKATIYIVRDPRNLISSISNHYSKTLEESYKFLTTSRFIGGRQNLGGIKKNDLVTLLGTWNDHFKFWTRNNENLLIIKYENLIKNTKIELERLITFLRKYIKIEINEQKEKNILRTTSFQYLKEMEKKGLFKENAFNKSQNKKVDFFNLGPENKWENLLKEDLKNRIEKIFKSEMNELGYLK
jgi:hypothetical protein